LSFYLNSSNKKKAKRHERGKINSFSFFIKAIVFQFKAMLVFP